MKQSSPPILRILVSFSVVLLAACQAPVGVRRADPTRVERELTGNIISAGHLSVKTRNALRWAAADAEYASDPGGVIEKLEPLILAGSLRGDERIHSLFVALAEVSFEQGLRQKSPAYFMQSVVYAWAYLFPKNPSIKLSTTNSQVQLAINLYNRGLTRAFVSNKVMELKPRSGVVKLPHGEIEVVLDEASIHWRKRILTGLTVASELEVRGMRNRYRTPGLGVALAASVEADPDGPPPGDRMIEGLKVPACALLLFTNFWEGLESGRFQAELAIHVGFDGESVDFNGVVVPLALEPTAAFAYTLAENAPWAREFKGFFRGNLDVGSGDGLSSLQPYQPGRIPVVLVHGTASSPARWAELLNDLMADPAIRDRFQFWLFTYNTGNPIAYSGWLLRKALRETVDALDPDDQDDALDHMVVMGHSQGGLLTKLAVINSGSLFWDLFSDTPIEEMKLKPESRELIEGSIFVEPVAEIERVVFIATPHRGSFAAASGLAQFLGRLAKSPANILDAVSDMANQDEEGAALRVVDRVDGSVANMNPGNPVLRTLLEIPISEEVQAHSIIAVRGKGPVEERSDGVVTYRSAHLDDVESEFVIESGHSVQDHPKVSLEVRRILHLHIGDHVYGTTTVEMR
jgi:pimeloyl-ACP methyl ester carboxylesterase